MNKGGTVCQKETQRDHGQDQGDHGTDQGMERAEEPEDGQHREVTPEPVLKQAVKKGLSK